MNKAGRPKGTTNADRGIEDSTKITMRITKSDIERIDEIEKKADSYEAESEKALIDSFIEEGIYPYRERNPYDYGDNYDTVG